MNILPDGTRQEGMLAKQLVEFGEYAERKDWFVHFPFEHQTAMYRNELIQKTTSDTVKQRLLKIPYFFLK